MKKDDKIVCPMGDEGYHRCSALHCDYCGNCPANIEENKDTEIN